MPPAAAGTETPGILRQQAKALWLRPSSAEVALGNGNPPPNAYTLTPPVLRGGRCNPTKTQSELERVIGLSRGIPAVGQYDPRPLPLKVRGGMFSTGYEEGLHDAVIRRAREIPGPHDTVPEHHSPQRGVKFSGVGLNRNALGDEYSPGPADYDVPAPPHPQGGRFSEANNLNLMHWVEKRARELPGTTGAVPKLAEPEGGRFPHRSATYLERLMAESATAPGPSDYARRSSKGDDHKDVSGGRFNEGKPKSDIEWQMFRAARIPGPAHYKVPRGLDRRGGTISRSVKTELYGNEIRRARLLPGPKYNPRAVKGYTSSHSVSALGVNAPTALDQHIASEKKTPGPGAFSGELRKWGRDLKGGAFHVSDSKSELEWTMFYAAQTPGPGRFSVMDMPGPVGGRLASKSASGPLPGFLDNVERLAKEVPGPGFYNPPCKTGKRGVAFSKNTTGRLRNPTKEGHFIPFGTKVNSRPTSPKGGGGGNQSASAAAASAGTGNVLRGAASALGHGGTTGRRAGSGGKGRNGGGSAIRVTVCDFGGKTMSLRVKSSDPIWRLREAAEAKSRQHPLSCILLHGQAPLMDEDQSVGSAGLSVGTTLRLAKRSWVGVDESGYYDPSFDLR